MILLGCLLAFSIAVAPRVVLILAWIFGDYWDRVWEGNWVIPLLGIIFLPYTTIMYMLVWTPTIGGGSGIEGWDWMWIILGLILDLSKWAGLWGNRGEATRQAQRYYPSGAPRYGGGGGTSAAISTGQMPPSASPAADQVEAGATVSTTPSEPPGDDKPGG
jgi:hypothetical protein